MLGVQYRRKYPLQRIEERRERAQSFHCKRGRVIFVLVMVPQLWGGGGDQPKPMQFFNVYWREKSSTVITGKERKEREKDKGNMERNNRAPRMTRLTKKTY